MKKKISITVDEETYEKVMEVWKSEQQENLKSKSPRPIKLSEVAEKILKRGLKEWK